MTQPARALVLRQASKQEARRSFKLRQVVLNRRSQNCVGRVEIAVSQAVSHPGDLRPRKIGRIGENVWLKRLYGLADLDQPEPDRVEHQAIAEITTREVCPDCIDGS